MNIMDDKVKKYMENNPIVRDFIYEVNELMVTNYLSRPGAVIDNVPKLRVEIGNKFIRIWRGTSCWGFISRVDNPNFRGAPIRKGDLLKPATWKQPAKHSRGNIIDGTARWDEWGPLYLNPNI
jgi:hypothetical protein